MKKTRIKKRYLIFTCKLEDAEKISKQIETILEKWNVLEYDLDDIN